MAQVRAGRPEYRRDPCGDAVRRRVHLPGQPERARGRVLDHAPQPADIVGLTAVGNEQHRALRFVGRRGGQQRVSRDPVLALGTHNHRRAEHG